MKIQGVVLERIGAPRPFATSRPLTLSELDLAAPGPHEVLVRIEAAGLCHSDLSVIDGNRPRPVPMLLGHEAAGIVEEIGSAVTDLAVGDRVVTTFLPRCGECAGCDSAGVRPCTAGSASNERGVLLDGGGRLTRDGVEIAHHLGVSGFATHAVVDHRSAVPVGHDVPAPVASLLGCAVLTGGGAVVNAGRPLPGQTLAVVGLGGVGMAAVLTALALDDVTVIGVDAIDDKLRQATALGASRVLTPAQVAEQGVMADVVIEAAGNARAFETAVAMTGPGGRTVTVGLPHPDARASISPLALVAGGRTIIGSYLGSAIPRRDIAIFADLWRAGRLPVEALVSSTVHLDGLNEAFDQLADGTVLRQLVTFD